MWPTRCEFEIAESVLGWVANNTVDPQVYRAAYKVESFIVDFVKYHMLLKRDDEEKRELWEKEKRDESDI